MDRQTDDGQTDGEINLWRNRQMDKKTAGGLMEGQTDGGRDKWRNRQMDGQTNGGTDRWIKRQLVD